MKWKPLRAAAILYVLTALTSYIVCGTYAKYVTSESIADSARAAKWGVTVFAEGRLFGEQYGSPANTVIHNPDGSITVKSHHEVSLGNGVVTRHVVAPGTKNDTGLVFGLTGKPETRVHVDVTIKNQNIALRTGVYYFLYRVKEPASSENVDLLLDQYGTLYQADGDGYQSITHENYDPEKQLYHVNPEERTNLVFLDSPVETTYKNWPYCPVVFSLNPVSGHGLIVDEHHNAATSNVRYNTSFKDKSLDIISWTLRWVGFDTGNAGLNNWPTMDENDVFTRSISVDYPANTDLSMVRNIPTFGVASERLTWEWAIERTEEEDKALYNRADSILGRLAWEKYCNGNSDDGIVVMEDRKLETVSGHYVYKGPKGNGRLVLPREYEDYCLETMFDLEITVKQVD